MDNAYTNREQARRRSCHSMDEWVAYMEILRTEVESHDCDVAMPHRLIPFKMLRGAGHSTEDRAQVSFNCSALSDTERMETVSRPEAS